MEKVNFRTQILARHLHHHSPTTTIISGAAVSLSPCLCYSLGAALFVQRELDEEADGRPQPGGERLAVQFNAAKQALQPQIEGRKGVCGTRLQSETMEQQREMTMKRIEYLLDHGVFEGWLTGKGFESEMRKLALLEVIKIFDHSLGIKFGVHFLLWGGAIQFLGTKRHHEKWLHSSENYLVKGCFAMTELGHGSNVRGIETVTTYDPRTEEFVVNTPCESAQKYWIGGAANHATHAVVFSQLNIEGKNEGVHAFIAQIRDADGNTCPNVRIADCGHKIGLNGVDNGRIWFDNVRIPRENILNSVADVSSDGKYLSAIKDAGQVRYAMSFAGNYLKLLYVQRTPQSIKTLHVVSSGFKAVLTWHNMRTLQECREACGGQGLKTENRIGQLKGEYDVQSTFEGDNNVLMQQGVYGTGSKALLAEYIASKKKNKPFEGLGLEHMNKSSPVIPSQLSASTAQSSQFQNAIFCLRERDLLNRFAAEVSRCQAQGKSKESAFISSYHLAEDLGRAFTDRAILQTFMEAENDVTDSSIKILLSLLRSLYVLASLDEDPSFLRYGYLTTESAVTVRTTVANLCSEIRPHSLALVSSFGIPDAFLSPIAFDWVAANSWSASQN